MNAVRLLGGAEPQEIALLEIDECDPLNGGITNPFFVREDVKPTLW